MMSVFNIKSVLHSNFTTHLAGLAISKSLSDRLRQKCGCCFVALFPENFKTYYHSGRSSDLSPHQSPSRLSTTEINTVEFQPVAYKSMSFLRNYSSGSVRDFHPIPFSSPDGDTKTDGKINTFLFPPQHSTRNKYFSFIFIF